MSTANPLTNLNELNTAIHVREQENKEYLKMREAQSKGACCRKCTDYRRLRFFSHCKFFEKRIEPYNICTHFKAGAKK